MAEITGPHILLVGFWTWLSKIHTFFFLIMLLQFILSGDV